MKKTGNPDDVVGHFRTFGKKSKRVDSLGLIPTDVGQRCKILTGHLGVVVSAYSNDEEFRLSILESLTPLPERLRQLIAQRLEDADDDFSLSLLESIQKLMLRPECKRPLVTTRD